MAELEKAEMTMAAQENRQKMNLTMVFSDTRPTGLVGRRYDLPAANEVAIIYVGYDGDVPSTRSLCIHDRGGRLINISHLDKRCDPLTYPLIFPTGADGWEPILQNSDGKRVSQMQFYAYLFAIRDSFNPILRAGKLFQQFAVDCFMKIEQNRCNYHRQHQSKMRAETYQILQNHVTGIEDFEGRVGRRIVLPSTFIGSTRHMQQSYQDAMAIVARFGKPDIFMTVTCNPKWKEIQENLYPGQSVSDRPDLIARVFHYKLKEIFTDIIKRKVLGEIAAYVMVIEFQKRGLPHCHTLLILKNEHKPRSTEMIDQVCKAEIPDPVTEANLHEAVKTFMLHRNCGASNPQAPCMKEGKCSKKFPKELRQITSTANDGYPRLRRRDRFVAQVGNQSYGDQWVVPYNSYSLQKLNCRINVEICGMIYSVKY